MTTPCLRCFFGLPPAAQGLQSLLSTGAAAQAIDPLPPGTLRYLRGPELHVTLKFLGSTSGDLIPVLDAILKAHAQTTAPILTRGQALSAFPSTRRAGVLVVRLTDPEQAMTRLANSIETACEALGIPRERRSFKPHVTLARLKRPTDVRAITDELDVSHVELAFGELVLYASRTDAHGNRYSVLSSAPLSASFRLGLE